MKSLRIELDTDCRERLKKPPPPCDGLAGAAAMEALLWLVFLLEGCELSATVSWSEVATRSSKRPVLLHVRLLVS